MQLKHLKKHSFWSGLAWHICNQKYSESCCDFEASIHLVLTSKNSRRICLIWPVKILILRMFGNTSKNYSNWIVVSMSIWFFGSLKMIKWLFITLILSSIEFYPFVAIFGFLSFRMFYFWLSKTFRNLQILAKIKYYRPTLLSK